MKKQDDTKWMVVMYITGKKKDIFTMGWDSHKRMYLKENNWGEVEKIKIHFLKGMQSTGEAKEIRTCIYSAGDNLNSRKYL